LFYNFLGSVAYALTYTWLGYFFGASWEILKAWMGRAGLISLVLLLAFALATFLLRRPAARVFNRLFKKRGIFHDKGGGN
jgi:membrane protein DedA with SNARE-associated domain